MGILESHSFVIFLGLAAALIAFALYFNWKRNKDLQDLASSMGIVLSSNGPDLGFLEGTGLELFRQGHYHGAHNLIEVASGQGPLRVFDYKFVTSTGKNSHNHNFTVALLACPGETPYFDLKPETIAYKIGEVVGVSDIDLPAFPLFSDKYRLTGPDEAAVHMFFNPQRAAWFEQHQGLRVQGAPGYLLFFRDGGRLPARAWQGFIEEAKVFAAEITQ